MILALDFRLRVQALTLGMVEGRKAGKVLGVAMLTGAAFSPLAVLETEVA